MNTRTVGATVAVRRPKVFEYLELTKPRITALVLVTTVVGFYMASEQGLDSFLVLHALVGTGLVAGGASALNQYLERHHDRRMVRTKDRPLPDGRISEGEALLFAGAISLGGVGYLLIFTTILTGALAALTLLLYAFVYTPLKTRTAAATLVGAVPGAAPPILGWTAAGGGLDGMAWALFAIVFLWQMPHFLAIAWVYDDDYVRGGFPKLSIRNAGEVSASRQIIFYCSVLVPVSLLPTIFGVTGTLYLFGAILLGFIYLGYGVVVAMYRSQRAALRLLRVSVLYLPLVLVMMLIDKVI